MPVSGEQAEAADVGVAAAPSNTEGASPRAPASGMPTMPTSAKFTKATSTGVSLGEGQKKPVCAPRATDGVPPRLFQAELHGMSAFVRVLGVSPKLRLAQSLRGMRRRGSGAKGPCACQHRAGAQLPSLVGDGDGEGKGRACLSHVTTLRAEFAVPPPMEVGVASSDGAAQLRRAGAGGHSLRRLAVVATSLGVWMSLRGEPAGSPSGCKLVAGEAAAAELVGEAPCREATTMLPTDRVVALETALTCALPGACGHRCVRHIVDAAFRGVTSLLDASDAGDGLGASGKSRGACWGCGCSGCHRGPP